jgi:dTDP-4-dehydrorhamnose reductase
LIVGDCLQNNILLLGGSGTLGKKIIKSKKFSNLKYPSKKKLNILNIKNLEKYIIENKIKIIIHCAAIARVKECEANKIKAKKINIDGTYNIVKTVLKLKKNKNFDIKLIFLSSDAVYPSIKGNYKETDRLSPYNIYGKTKYLAEKYVKKLKKFIIIRTRFFDKNKIKFKYSARNIFTSAIEVNLLVKYIAILNNKNFLGIINVGGPKISDYLKYKRYKKKLKSCDKKKIFNELNFKIASDASMNINKLKKFYAKNRY